jgi:hypothetical protein
MNSALKDRHFPGTGVFRKEHVALAFLFGKYKFPRKELGCVDLSGQEFIF